MARHAVLYLALYILSLFIIILMMISSRRYRGDRLAAYLRRGRDILPSRTPAAWRRAAEQREEGGVRGAARYVSLYR